ncbi:MAG: hypothetical protein Q4B67_02825, partial [Eubacteriales bacterium]|nr:hypothetical protein [Eubacteriales bacterium]
LMEAVKSYDNSANAIGYSVYYYANDMRKARGLKILSVDGVEPNADTIRAKKYPHLNAYYCVIGEEEPEDSPVRKMYEWFMTKEGQELVLSEGYIATGEPEKLSETIKSGETVKTDYTYYVKNTLPEDKFTRLEEGPMNSLKARDDYGTLYPYVGGYLFSDDGSYSYQAGSMNGFYDAKGRLVTDPVYSGIDIIGYNDSVTFEYKTIPFYRMSTADESGEKFKSTFASIDGKVVCDKTYDYVMGLKNRIFCINYALFDEEEGYAEDARDTFDIYDFDGNLVLNSEDVPWASSLYNVGDDYYVFQEVDKDFYYHYYLTDLAGKKILGPYEYIDGYQDGRAVVELGYKNGDILFNVVDLMDNRLFQETKTSVTRLKDGSFVVRNMSGQNELATKNGKVIKLLDDGFITATDFGFINQKQDSFIKCYNFEGELLFEDYFDSWYTAGEKGIIYSRKGAGIYIVDIMNDKQLYIEGAEDLSPFYNMDGMEDGRILRASNYYYDEAKGKSYMHNWILNENLDIIKDIKDCYIYMNTDHITGEKYYVIEKDVNDYEYYDLDFKQFGKYSTYYRIVGGQYMTDDEYGFTARDKDGNIVFRYNFVNSYDD